MKTTIITASLLIASFFNLGTAIAAQSSTSNSSEITLGEETLPMRKISIKLLDAEEAKHMLNPASKWMVIQSSDKQSSDHFKLLDSNGQLQANGYFKNGKALLNITNLNSGKYLIVVGETAHRSIQPLELLN